MQTGYNCKILKNTTKIYFVVFCCFTVYMALISYSSANQTKVPGAE